MKYALLYLSIVLTVVCPQMRAQEPAMPLSGSKAMIFSFSGLSALNLNQFEGGIGGKYLMSGETAIRAGMQFAVAGQSLPADPGPGQTGTDGSLSATRIGVSGALEYHLTRTRISPFFGGGLGVSFTSTESKNAVVGATPQTTTSNNQNGVNISGNTFFGGTTITFFGLLGVEYFLTNGVSFAAEYRLGYSTTSRYDEEETTGNQTITTRVGSTNLIGFTTGGALVLAVYF